MSSIVRYNYSNIDKLFNDIEKYSIGLESFFDRVKTVNNTQSNYPPYNLIKLSDTEYKIELAASGFKSNELTVYTENGQLVIEGNKSSADEKEYVYRSLSHRNFTRVWSISDDVVVKSVSFEDGLLEVLLDKVVPEHQKKKVHF